MRNQKMTQHQSSKTIYSLKIQKKSVYKTVKVKPKKKTNFKEEFLKYINILIALVKLIHLINS